LRQMATRPPAQCGPAAVDVLFVQRDTHMARTIYRFEEERQCYCDAPSEGEWPQIQDMVLRHEGEAALAILDHWVKRQPQGLIAVRDAHRALVGFLFQLEVNGLTAADAAPDPVMLRFLGYLNQREAMQAHERAILVRSWMAADGYQALSAVQTQVCAYIMLATLTTANLAYVLHLQPDVEAWTRISAECGQTRLPGPAVTIGRYRAALYAHDYRQETALEWMCGLHRSLRGLPAPGAVALDQEAFAAAVRQALKDYVSPRALADNPLLAAALVARNPEAPGENPVEVLRGLLHSHCEYLKTSPRTAALYKILHRSYLQPARNQALAAEALYLSERTYRRRLAQALEQVAASLWLTEQELV
ncbi:MAG: hypothetical protein L0H83_07050, partial [Salinisphaera sp.]|nr:hypothetical protein [Salinisphaera sp.]